MAHEWWHMFGADEDEWGGDMGFGYDPDEIYYSDDEDDPAAYGTPIGEMYQTAYDYPESFYSYDPKAEDSYDLTSTELMASYPTEPAKTYQPELEQSYADMARETIAKYMPFVKTAQQVQKFAGMMSAKRQKQGGGAGGGGRQVQAPYTTHKAGTSGRIQADIQSSFRGRDSRQLMALLSQQSRQAASGVQIVANKAADVGEKIKGNDLYDLISGETKPLGAKQQLPTGQSFRSLSIRRTQRA